jgi:polyisoprenoid-binding protein YceI
MLRGDAPSNIHKELQMSLTDVVLSATGLPTGTWRLDRTHSSAGFAVKHMAVSTFRGRFEKFDATLTVGQDWAELVGVVDAGSLVVKDENLQAHLGSPEFFDIERHPEITFHSTSIWRAGDELVVDGELTSRGTPAPSRRGGRSRAPRSLSAMSPSSG